MSTLTILIGSLFFGCFIATAALTPFVMAFARRINAVDRGGFRKVFQGEMPLLGGLGVAGPLLLLGLSVGSMGFVVIRHWKWLWIHHRDNFDFIYSLATDRSDYLCFVLGGTAILLLGILDDTLELSARRKLFGQFMIALLACALGEVLTAVSVPFFGTIDLGPIAGVLLTMLWIVGLINAFNLIDGIDGLASGLALVGAAALLALGVIQENLFVIVNGAALAGSVTGFLCYNFPPAKIFLGDTGSMFLGYTLAVLSLQGSQKSETAVIILAPILALSLPIFETFVSIVRRYVRGVPLFVGDKHHTHHRLLGKGYSQPRVVLTLCGTGVLLAVAAVMSAVIPNDSPWISFPYFLYVSTLFAIAWIGGYLRPERIRVIMERRDRNRVFGAFGRYARLRLHSGRGSVNPDLVLELCRQEMDLRKLEVHLDSGNCVIASRESSSAAAAELAHISEEILVTAVDGQKVRVCYEFKTSPDEERRRDVSACLATVFDRIPLAPSAGQKDSPP